MDASILIAGSQTFLAAFVKRISDLLVGNVESVTHFQQVIPRLQNRLPHILLLQANLEGSLSLCQEIRQQSELSGLYCLLVDSCFYSLDGLSLDDRANFMMLGSEALEAGADAYLPLPLLKAEKTPLLESEIELQNRLLKAQILAGLRYSQTYRQLLRTNDLLSTIALCDPLTEINNRRALDWDLPRQIQNSRQRNLSFSLIILDIDHFKGINDNHGHLIGDRILKLAAGRLSHNLRFQDTLFRYGGEEFVITLNNTPPQEAHQVADRLCHLLQAQPFSIHAHLSLQITASFGIATLKASDDPKGISLLERADQCLLKAKAAGRNQVVSDGS